jgi:hypothetical protein
MHWSIPGWFTPATKEQIMIKSNKKAAVSERDRTNALNEDSRYRDG